MKYTYFDVLARLQSKQILKSIRIIPPFIASHRFTILKLVASINDKIVTSYGVSSKSKEIAFAKSVGELVERLSFPKDMVGSGLAAGFTKELVILSGLYELIERDSFMLYILSGVPFRVIEEKIIWKILKRPRSISPQLKFMFFDLTSDLGIPTYGTVIMTDNKTVKTMVAGLGLKSNINSRKALMGSFEEAVLEITLKKSSTIIKTKVKDTPLLSESYFLDRINNNYISVPFLDISFPLQPLQSELDYLQEVCKKNKIKCTYTQIKIPFFNEIPYQLWKVASPTLQPIIFFFDRDKSGIRHNRMRNFLTYIKKA